ncbi:MAG: ThiF family adenylyltransferase [Halodesulfovibrio sp.]|uniref:ThiF family adenylyltransferase n=1 Tax=Halodesulfovibrio sp. TaxID=1912772 RepID=UPI00359EB562
MANIFFPQYFYKAVGSVQRLLKGRLDNLNSLSLEELNEIKFLNKSKYVRGWYGELKISDEYLGIYLMVDNQYPFTEPKIHLHQRHFSGQWLPHVDPKNGEVCLLGPEEKYVPSLDAEIVNYLFEKLEKLILSTVSKENFEHFVDEYLSYWANYCFSHGAPSPDRWSLLDSNAKFSRIVIQATFKEGKKSRYIIAESQKVAAEWIVSYRGSLRGVCYQNIPFVWLEQGPYPHEYPLTSLTLSELVLSHAGSLSATVMKNCTPRYSPSVRHKKRKVTSNDLPVCMGLETQNGTTFFGVTACAPTRSQGPKNPPSKWTPPRSANSGLPFFSTDGLVRPFLVKQFDHKWIYFRGGNNFGDEMKDIRIVVIGAGSLGARVIEQLCLSGIGGLTVFDPDLFEIDNVGRHLLGVESVGKNKAKATVEYLNKKYPHLEMNSYDCTSDDGLQDKTLSNVILSADLVISTTGDLLSNRLLSNEIVRLMKSGRLVPPVIFSWAEPYCCAGKAIYVDWSDECLECGIKGGQEVVTQATLFANGAPQEMVPACNISFMPYGTLEMTPIANMTASLAIQVVTDFVETSTQFVYIASEMYLKKHGGEWAEWIKPYLPVAHEGLTFSIPWEGRKDCSICKN